MKKFIVVLVFISLCVIGCGKKEEPKKQIETYGNSEGIVITYHGGPAGVENPVYQEATLRTDKSIQIGKSNEDGFKTVSLTQSQYDEILEEAFGEKFLSLKSEDIGEEVEGGYYERITLYYDGKTFTVGGSNIRNKTFQNVKNMLLK